MCSSASRNHVSVNRGPHRACLLDYSTSFVSLSRWTRNLEETCSVTPSLYTRPFYILSSTHENCQTGRIFPSARNVVAEAIKTGHPGVIRLRHVRTIERASPFGRKELGAGNGLLDYKTDTLRRCINPAVYWPARNKAPEASPCSAPGLIGLTGFARISFTHAPSFGASISINPDFVSISRRRVGFSNLLEEVAAFVKLVPRFCIACAR